MADDEKSLEIVIRTTAELEGAHAAEAQLERKIAQARTLGQVLPHDVLPHGHQFPGEEPGENPPVEAGTPAAAAGGDGMEAPGGDEGWAPSEGTGDDAGQADGMAVTENEEPPELAEQCSALPYASDAAGDGQIFTPPFPASDGERNDDDRARPQPAGVGTFQIEGAFESQTEAQAQATAVAGEKLRAAMERNGQATVSLLNRTLELVEQQSRRLDGVERRIAELAGQIKSLRNP